MIVVVTDLPNSSHGQPDKVAFHVEDVELMRQTEDGSWWVWLDMQDENGEQVELRISADDAARIAAAGGAS